MAKEDVSPAGQQLFGLDVPLRSNRPLPYFPGSEPEETEEEKRRKMLDKAMETIGATPSIKTYQIRRSPGSPDV